MAPLQIEKFQGVVGAVGEGVVVPVIRIGSIFTRRRKYILQGRNVAVSLLIIDFLAAVVLVISLGASIVSLVVIDDDLSGGEVDLQAEHIMDTAQVRHQHIVDEHPHIVITGEVVGDFLSSRRLAALLLDKAGGHA